MHSLDDRLRDEAARQIWLRFAERLETLVRRRLDPRVLRRTGPDDVVQSLFASYFAAGPGPDGPPRDRAELWRRLVRFAMCKVASTAKQHRAQRRDVRREQPLEGPNPSAGGQSRGAPPDEPVDRYLIAPEFRAIAQEEFDRLLTVLPEDLQRVFTLRLQGYTNAEIALQMDRVERTVELKLRAIRAVLGPHLRSAALDPSP
jgi:RNA polymerase sigma-70 factor (ECF subfamily)